MANLMLLADELKNDPLAVGYATMDDRQAADSLNAKTRPTTRNIATADIKRYLFTRGLWLTIKKSTVESAEKARDGISMFETFHMDKSDVVNAVTAVLDALIADGLITNDDKVAVQQMSVELVSRAEELDLLTDFNRITPFHVYKARLRA